MEIFNDFNTSVQKALSEIDPQWKSFRGLIICGTHSQNNVDELIEKIRFARENNIPTLLICAGHQLGAIEYARSILGISDATSEEFGTGTFVVKKRPHGKVGFHDGESWWSYYDVVIDYKTPDHFVSVPFHPEYQSSKDNPHHILVKFLDLCRKHQ